MSGLPKSFYMWAASEFTLNAGYWSEMAPAGGGNPSTTHVAVLDSAPAAWQGIATAPRDGSWFLAQLGQITDETWSHWSGRCFVVRHGGFFGDPPRGDMGWHLFPGFSCGDEWIARWQPFTPPEDAQEGRGK